MPSNRSLATVAVLVSLGAGACTSSGSPAPVPDPPSGLTYPSGAATYVKGTAIAPNTPTVGGGPVDAWTVARRSPPASRSPRRPA